MKFKYYIAVLVLVFASCANPEKITFHGPITVDVESGSRITASCRVENCSAHKIRLISAKFRLHYATGDLAVVMLAQPVGIAKCRSEEVAFPLRVRFANPLMALTAANLESLDWENLYVTGEGIVVSGIGKRRIRLTNFPAHEFLSNFESGGGIRMK